MIDMNTQKEAAAKRARTVVDGTVAYGTKAVEASAGAAETATDKLKDVLARSKNFAETGITKVTTAKVGDKKVSEHARATVDSVQSAVDVDQISGQVAKLREQIEGVLGTWKETFRPSTETAPKSAPKPAAQTTKYTDLTVDELRHLAAEADISGRSTMKKAQLIAALKKSDKASTSK
jgi:hypothetical protein